MATKRQSYTTSEKLKIVSVCGFNDNRNYNFFLESVLKNRVRIIYGCALYTGKYGMSVHLYKYVSFVSFTIIIICITFDNVALHWVHTGNWIQNSINFSDLF